MAEKDQQTAFPDQVVSPLEPTLTAEEKQTMGQDLSKSLETALAQRQDLDKALEWYSNLYEMQVGEINFPWPNASNLFVPIIPTYTDSDVASLAQQVFVPRLFVARGTTPEAAHFDHEVERYYNTEAWRHGWIEAGYQALSLSSRDGTGIIEILWHKQEHQMKVKRQVPEVDEQGEPMLNLASGEPKMKDEVVVITITEFNDAKWTAVELRDFVMVPAWHPNPQTAPAVWRALYLTEDELREMAASGDLWKDAVEAVISYVQSSDELTYDRQGTSTYTAGDKVDVSPQETSDTMGGSTIKVWRIHTKQFDLDKNKIREENVLWFHERSSRLLGAKAYEYWHGKRPFVIVAPRARPNRTLGLGVPEMLAPINTEVNALHNQRRNEIDLRLSPPRYKTAGAVTVNKDRPWGPQAEYEVQNKDDIGIIQMPDVLPSSYQEEENLLRMAERRMGKGDPQIGRGGTQGRRTKYEMQVAVQAASVRENLSSHRVRLALKDAFWQTHQLKLQYGPDTEEIDVSGTTGQPKKLQISKAKLALDYELDINGSGSPLDKNARRQDMLFLYSLMTQNPLVQQDMTHYYAVTRGLLEEYDRADQESWIGTEEGAQQLQQQMMQARAQQQAMEAQQNAAGAGGGGPRTAEPRPQTQQRRRKPQGGGVSGV